MLSKNNWENKLKMYLLILRLILRNTITKCAGRQSQLTKCAGENSTCIFLLSFGPSEYLCHTCKWGSKIKMHIGELHNSLSPSNIIVYTKLGIHYSMVVSFITDMWSLKYKGQCHVTPKLAFNSQSLPPHKFWVLPQQKENKKIKP